MSFKEFASRLVSLPYELIFKQQISRDAANLLKGTSYVAIGTLSGALLTLAFNILGARILGPENFGNLALIGTIGTILQLSMGISLIPMIKYASGARNNNEQALIISTAYIQMAFLTVASVVVYVLLSSPLSYVFGTSVTLYLFALMYAVALMFFGFTINSLRIFFKMKTYALLNVAQSAIVLIVFLSFISSDVRSWQSAAYSLIISYVVISFISLVYLRKYMTLRLDRFWSKRILRYVRFALPGTVAVAFLGVDKILINILRSTADVGIYNAYFLTSLSIASMLWGIINVAFFPYASKSNDRAAILVKINKAAPYLAVSLVPLFMLLGRIVFILYGRQYSFSWELAFFFALAATSVFFYGCYSWLMASEGTRGAKVNAFSSIIALVVLVGFDVVLIPLIGILGAAITLILTYLTATFYLASRGHILSESR